MDKETNELKYKILKDYYGYDNFRSGQEEIIDALISGKDAVCIMPTGAGKSICYQVPAMVLPGVTIVISPLIALMKDQVGALLSAGIPSAFLNSSQSEAEYKKVLSDTYSGNIKLLYAAPERLMQPAFLEMCSKIDVSMVAVDEAHCISQWGQDFRPHYLRIVDFIDSLPKRPIVSAFTATATGEVRDDISNILKLDEPFSLTLGFDRPNLYFSVEKPANKPRRLVELLESRQGESGIVYCSTRKAVEQVCNILVDWNIRATRYHAGLADGERKKNQEDFVHERKNVMVATNAFGMGIDKSNVSFVIHYNMPKNIEAYYQEAGRAGRDGEKADCILLYSGQDVHTGQFLIKNSEPNPDLSESQQAEVRIRDLERLKYMTYYATGTECLRGYMLRYFGEKAPDYCGNCSNCLNNYEETDITEDAQKILSCIYKTGQRYGIALISQVLKGSRVERIMSLGLDEQSTYGLMNDYTLAKIREIINALLTQEIIESTHSEYPVLVLTPASADILKGRRRISMKLLRDSERKESKKGKTAHTSVYTDYDATLFDSLKELRTELARREHVPAYIIFNNAALTDMCRKLPETETEFLQVSGVGKAKNEKYGKIFLAKIAEFKNKKSEAEPGE